MKTRHLIPSSPAHKVAPASAPVRQSPPPAPSFRAATREAAPIRILSCEHIDAATPMGATILPGGAGVTFRVWAPAARELRLLWKYAMSDGGSWHEGDEGRLTRQDDETWVGFVPNIGAGERYLFYVVGPEGGTEGLKRDPFARELTQNPAWPDCQCEVVDPAAFPWHDQGFRPPLFHELVIFQLHVGTWYIPLGREHGTFLDVIEKLPYLRQLGINAIQPLPIVEFPTMFSLGYNGVDYFSPETDYAVKTNDPALDGYVQAVNQRLLDLRPEARPYVRAELEGSTNQLKAMVDLCHVYGIAVLFDVVYNHAGGDFGDRGLYFFDERAKGNNNDSLYFTDRGWAGGLVFAYWNDPVKSFLIENAKYYLTEVHGDGFRYDEVSVIKDLGGEHGWRLCQYATDTCHYVKPEAIHIAECWPVQQAIVNPTSQNGAGFDATQNDGLREAVRSAIGQASQGAQAWIDFDRIARELASPILADSWRAVQCTENHDIVRAGRGWRIPQIADGSGDSVSWYVRSRSRVALGLTLAAAGIPHVFMGQECLTREPWTDDPEEAARFPWSDAEGDRHRMDFLRFARELIGARRALTGLRGAGLNVFHVHNQNRVLAFQRWVPGEGADVVVVVSLNEATYYGYQLGFPASGVWREVFNSDAYDFWPNPIVAGNGGEITAVDSGLHGLPASAALTIPANSVLIFTR